MIGLTICVSIIDGQLFGCCGKWDFQAGGGENFLAERQYQELFLDKPFQNYNAFVRVRYQERKEPSYSIIELRCSENSDPNLSQQVLDLVKDIDNRIDGFVFIDANKPEWIGRRVTGFSLIHDKCVDGYVENVATRDFLNPTHLFLRKADGSFDVTNMAVSFHIKCPECGSHNIKTDECLRISGLYNDCRMNCIACGHKWEVETL